MQKMCLLQCINEEYGVISHCQMFSIRCMNGYRKVTLLCKSWRYEEKMSRKKEKLKKGRRRNPKSIEKRKKEKKRQPKD